MLSVAQKGTVKRIFSFLLVIIRKIRICAFITYKASLERMILVLGQKRGQYANALS